MMGMGDKPFLQEAWTMLPERAGMPARLVQLLAALVITISLALLAGNTLRYSATEHDPNIVINGSFEEPVLSGDPAPNNWDHFPDWAVDGWHSITPSTPIEIMRGDKGPAAEGVQYVELDSNGIATGIYQDLETIPDTVYRIEWQFAARPETGPGNNEMHVYWGGPDGELAGPADPVQLDGTGHAVAVWAPYWNSAAATSEITRLEFRYAGTLNSLGALLDDVVVYAPACESVGDGAWNVPETWQCSPGMTYVPGPGNDVVIQNGHTIVLDGDAVADNLTIEAGGALDNTGGYTLTVYGDVVLDGTYLKATTDPTDTVVFKGDKEQKVTGEKEEVEFNKVKVDKEKKTGSDEKSTVEFQKKLKVKKQTEIEKGKLKVGEAEFEGDVQIDEDGELAGTEGEKKTYHGDKTVDGTYTHNKSKDEFSGGDDQKIKGGSEKQDKLEYHELLIKKQQQKQAEFQKKLLVKDKTEIEDGKLKVGDAEFEGDVEIKQEGELEGTENKKKTYHGDKTVDGTYTHNKSKDEFTGDKALQKLQGSKETKYFEMELKKSKQNDLLDAMTKLHVEKQLRLILGTLKTNTIFQDVLIEEGAVLILGDGDDPTQVQGNWINDGDFDPGSGTVIFNGTDPQSIGGQSTTLFNNLEIQNTTTLEQTIVVNGTLKLSSPLVLGEGGEIEKGENFQVEVGSGGNLGIGCDPGNTKLTGSGWFNSPAGSFLADESLTGKAHINFPIHCGNEGSAPTGKLGFKFDAANLDFISTSIDSMLVLGDEVTVTGYGQVSGAGEYGFAAVVVVGSPGNSGEPDRISVVIWDRSDGSTVYDSEVNGTGPIATGGGNIKIHTGSSGGPGGGGSQGNDPGGSGHPGKGPGGNGPPGRR